jgi:hypothetical protein
MTKYSLTRELIKNAVYLTVHGYSFGSRGVNRLVSNGDNLEHRE